jgi:arginine-tRNA-protein transferase
MIDGILATTLSRSVEPCPYLPGCQADFEHYWFLQYDDDSFCQVIEAGVRRFGDYFFRPACPGAAGGGWCGACLPLRVDVAAFRPNKSQRRAARRAAVIKAHLARPRFTFEKYQLYLRHKARFTQEAAEDALGVDAFRQSFFSPNPFTVECTYTIGGELIGAGYLDIASRVLSSIYFYFDPRYAEFSPGTFSILYELALARRLSIPYYYLGYAVHDCQSMRYKMDFRPCQAYDGQGWRELRDAAGGFVCDPRTLRTAPPPPLAITTLPDE